MSGFAEWEGLGRTESERWRVRVRADREELERAAVRRSLTGGRPFGSGEWVGRMARRLGIEWTPHPRGRLPKDQ